VLGYNLVRVFSQTHLAALLEIVFAMAEKSIGRKTIL
jgi:hypothetical protein